MAEDEQHLRSHLPTEEEVEEEANSRTGLTKHFRVARCEYARFAIFGLMFFVIGFVYSFMRIIKDTYVMVRQEPVCILYLKVFYILPVSFAVIILINYMLSSRTISRIFSISCLAFTGLFFAFSALVLFEEAVLFDPLTIKAEIDLSKLETRGLGFLSNLLLTVNEPIATMVYITAELWGSIMLSYLFLSFLNETCTRKQHARFLPPLFILANVSLLCSALITTFFFHVRSKLTFEQNTLMMSGVFFGEGMLSLSVLFCKYLLERRVMVRPVFRSTPSVSTQQGEENASEATPRKASKGKAEIGFMEGFQIMSQSKFLFAMSGIVFFFSAVFNILETVHKNGVKRGAEYYGVEKGKYSGRFNNIEQYITALSVICLNMSSFSNLTDTRGWMPVALISPIIAGISVVGILGMAIYNASAGDQSLSWTNKVFSGAKQFLLFEKYMGMACLAAMKIFKFTAFDVTKEKISMRIEDKYRPKFKSVFDGIFNKLGKSIGAVYGILLSTFFTDIDIRGFSPMTAALTVPAIFAWLLAVFYLGRSYNKSIATNSPVDIDLAEEEEEQQPMAPKAAPEQEIAQAGTGSTKKEVVTGKA